jgi:hypothetical protein
MYLNEIKTQLKGIVSNDLESGFKAIKELVSPDSNQYNSLIQLEGRYKNVLTETRKELISYEQKNIAISTIMASLIEEIDNLQLNSLRIDSKKSDSDNPLMFLNSQRIYSVEKQLEAFKKIIVGVEDKIDVFYNEFKEDNTQNKRLINVLLNDFDKREHPSGKERPENVFKALKNQFIPLAFSIFVIVNTFVAYLAIGGSSNAEPKYGLYLIISITIFALISLGVRMKHFSYKNPWWVCVLKDTGLGLVFAMVNFLFSAVILLIVNSYVDDYFRLDDAIPLLGVTFIASIIGYFVIFFVMSLLLHLIRLIF